MAENNNTPLNDAAQKQSENVQNIALHSQDDYIEIPRKINRSFASG